MTDFSDTRYDSMIYNRCGKSGLLLPKITLGCWHSFGGRADPELTTALLRRAFDEGITHFDLANNYGPPPGSAEENVGKILTTEFSEYRDELIISTKAGWPMWPGPYGDLGSKKYLVASLDQSLQRLGLDYVDIFYHHRPDTATPLEESIGALDLIVRQGKALYVGISSYNPEQTRQATQIARKLGTPLIVNQVRYSMLDRRIEDGLLEQAEHDGIGLTLFSSLEQGILAGRYLDGIPDDSRAASPDGYLKPEYVKDKDLEKVRQLVPIAEARDQSLAELALTWALRDERVTSAIIGVSKMAQLEQCLKVVHAQALSESELHAIEHALGD
jgi:L-glyceraldehyde 3-phosphate reductase